MTAFRFLFVILLIINFSCQKATDEGNKQIAELEEQQTDRLRHLPSINPIQGGKIISQFGQQVDSLANTGIDIALEMETDVHATADGKIVDVKHGSNYAENVIVIDHGHGYQTRYSNLSEILVEKNQSVKRWTILGKIEKTTDQPAMLHYEVIKDGMPEDPGKFIFD